MTERVINSLSPLLHLSVSHTHFNCAHTLIQLCGLGFQSMCFYFGIYLSIYGRQAKFETHMPLLCIGIE